MCVIVQHLLLCSICLVVREQKYLSKFCDNVHRHRLTVSHLSGS